MKNNSNKITKVEEITKKLLTSYKETAGVNHLDQENLPSKRSVELICKNLLQIIFPGYHDEEPISHKNLEKITLQRISSLINRTEEEICKALNCENSVESNSTQKKIKNIKNIKNYSKKITYEFFETLPNIRKIIKTDVKAAYTGDPAADCYDEIILSYPCIEAIAIQRLAHILFLNKIPFIPRMMTEWAHSVTGIDIHPGASIGSHFFIDHGTGVVIGETCKIGSNVKLYHGVTLGARSFVKDKSGNIKKGGKRHPDVEDNVTIYPNATILGGKTTIGKGSTIGANVFVMQSVPPNTLISAKEKSPESSKL